MVYSKRHHAVVESGWMLLFTVYFLHWDQSVIRQLLGKLVKLVSLDVLKSTRFDFR